MLLEERVPQYVEDIKQKYSCDESELNYPTINKNKKQILHNKWGKKIYVEMNELVDLDYLKSENLIADVDEEIQTDFARESNEIEDIKDIDTMAFLEDDETTIDHTYENRGVHNNLSPRELAMAMVAGCAVTATNPKMGVLKFTTNHLEALKYVLKEARESRLKYKSKGEYAPLTHEIVTNANEMVLPGEYQVASFYRNEYTMGSCHVTGAKWTPVANTKVPARMEALIKWFNEEKDMNPIVKAAIFHCEFIAIHPFFDGNGRTARLLVNYELTRHNLPTIVIKSKNKKAYLEALEKGITTGDVTDVAKLIEQRVLDSQNKQICAIDRVRASQKKPLSPHNK